MTAQLVAPLTTEDADTDVVLPVIVTVERPYNMRNFGPDQGRLNQELPEHLKVKYGEPVNDVRFHAELIATLPVCETSGEEAFRARLPTFGMTVIRVM